MNNYINVISDKNIKICIINNIPTINNILIDNTILEEWDKIYMNCQYNVDENGCYEIIEITNDIIYLKKIIFNDNIIVIILTIIFFFITL